jgi:hypothetical protein
MREVASENAREFSRACGVAHARQRWAKCVGWFHHSPAALVFAIGIVCGAACVVIAQFI